MGNKIMTLFTIAVLTIVGGFTFQNVSASDGTGSEWTLNNLEVSADYKEALKTANEFLIAWKNRDAETGVTLVTETVKNEKHQKEGDTPSQLEAYFIGTSNPYHHSIEIVGKEKVNENTYKFNVWMHEYYTGQDEESTATNEHSTLVRTLEVTKNAEGQWLVNNLP